MCTWVVGRNGDVYRWATESDRMRRCRRLRVNARQERDVEWLYTAENEFEEDPPVLR